MMFGLVQAGQVFLARQDWSLLKVKSVEVKKDKEFLVTIARIFGLGNSWLCLKRKVPPKQHSSNHFSFKPFPPFRLF